MRVVTYEDRAYDIVGLKLLVLSLARHCPGIDVDIICPGAESSLGDWLSGFPTIHLHPDVDFKHRGFNVKPAALQWLLRNGEDEAVWIDTDVIVGRDFRGAFSRIPAQAIAVTQDYFGAPYQGGLYRSKAWGLAPGRALRATVNTAVVRVTKHHIPLLKEWETLLGNGEYIKMQQRPWNERPIHMQGDQDVLTALLESNRFINIPIRFIKRGREIVHCFQHQGYAAHQMVGNLLTRNRPYFVHSQGAKPWRTDDSFRVFLDTSTYTLCALEYYPSLREPAPWLAPKSWSGKLVRSILRDDPWLSGLPLALAQEAKNQRVLKTAAKKLLGKP